MSAFGPDSAARHRLLGCTDLAVERDSTLHRDVDTAAQLSEAVALGVGRHTSAVLRLPRPDASATFSRRPLARLPPPRARRPARLPPRAPAAPRACRPRAPAGPRACRPVRAVRGSSA